MSRPTRLFHLGPWPTGVRHLVVGFGAIAAAACVDVHMVNAAPTAAKSAWCVETADSGVPSNCTYDNYLTCAVAAIRAGGLCKTESGIPQNAIDASHHRAPASSRRSAQSTTAFRVRESSLSTVEREKLFREFVEWNRRRSNQ